MTHKCETTETYINAKGEMFYVVREWEGCVGRFIKASNGRRGYGKFWTKEGWSAGRRDEVAYFTRTAMNGRAGLVERLIPLNTIVQRVNVPTISLPL